MERPPDLSTEVKRALYEEEALERGRERLLSELRKRGHLRAEVKTRADTEDGGRTLLFEEQPGPPLTVADARFPGATVFAAGRLLKEAGGVAIMMADPRQAQERLRLLYREHHYLTTQVKTPQVVEDAGRLYA